MNKADYQYYFKKQADGTWMEVIVEMDDETHGHVIDALIVNELPAWTKDEKLIYMNPELTVDEVFEIMHGKGNKVA